MDSNSGIQLFGNDLANVALPNIDNEEVERQNKELTSSDITKAISGKMVKTLILPEEAVIDEANYIFDLSNVESISVFKKEALKSLLIPESMSDPETDVSIYLYNKSGKLMKVGVGNKYKLEGLVPLLKTNIFLDTVKIYKNFKVGEPAVEVKGRDITKLRLNL